MAKNNKDDDELNDDFGLGSDDANDADDNFGLPDVEYKSLEEAEEEESEKEEESSSEPEEEEAPVTSEDTSEEEYRESYEGDGNGDDYEYEDESKSDSIAPKLILITIILVVVAGAVWYFGFYSPAQKAAEEQARLAQQQQEQADAAARRAEQERLAREQAVQDSIARAQQAQEEATPETGEMTTISSRTGRYYVVVGSFVDDDLAKDLADKLGVEGLNTSLIPPWGDGRYYRLAIADLGSFDEAQARADELKSTYGDGLWVLKY